MRSDYDKSGCCHAAMILKWVREAVRLSQRHSRNIGRNGLSDRTLSGGTITSRVLC